MTLVTYASGSISAVIGTEHFLSSPNVAGEFAPYLDASNMVAGDVLEVRAYKMVIAGGTSRAFWFAAFYGAQPAHAQILLGEWIPNALTDTNAVRFSIKQTFGTGRDFAWSVNQRQDATVAAADIRAAIGMASANLDTQLSGVPAAVWASGTRTLTSFGTLVADTVTGVWNALTSGLTTAGSIGKWLLDHIGAIETTVTTMGASNVTLVSPVREVGGEQEIELVQGQTQSIANGNSIDIVFTGVPDTTGGAVTLTLTDEMGTIQSVTGNPYTGTLGAWAAGSVTARFEMMAAQTASIAIKLSTALEKNNLRFQVKITLAANGVIIPIAPKEGRVTVRTQAHA